MAWQKRVRRLFRSLAIPHATYVAIWEECYFRWCALTELVINAPTDPMTAESIQDSTVPVGDKSMTFEVRFHWLRKDSFVFTSVYAGATTPVAKLDALPSSMRLGMSH